LIEIVDLYKYYGELRAVGPVSTSIEGGHIVGLLGLNGAGKTTTLRVLACDLLPTGGTVRVDGVDVVEEPHRVRASTGYLPEAPPLYGEMTVREYLRFAATLRGVPSRELKKRVREAEDFAGVHRVRNQVISTLSHGFRQRLGIAQAIVHRPRLVILDEPSSGLDPVQIVEMRQVVKNLAGNHTVVVSSHILSEISEICDRILVMRDGVICAAGTEEELVSRYVSGMRVDVSVRIGAARGEAAARQVLEELPNVGTVTSLPVVEDTHELARFRIDSAQDIRAEVCASLVTAGFGVLELARTQHELESVFLSLQREATAAEPAPETTATGVEA
jgi:ABC-2 type transport system ATP-binding protein